jgi:hypothetical protein
VCCRFSVDATAAQRPITFFDGAVSSSPCIVRAKAARVSGVRVVACLRPERIRVRQALNCNRLQLRGTVSPPAGLFDADGCLTM